MQNWQKLFGVHVDFPKNIKSVRNFADSFPIRILGCELVCCGAYCNYINRMINPRPLIKRLKSRLKTHDTDSEKKNEIMKPQTNQGVNPRKTADGERCNLQRMKLRLTTNKEVTVMKTPTCFTYNTQTKKLIV
jgi:hypothetical protein